MAYTPTYVNNNSFLTPTIWNDTQDGIKNIKETAIDEIEPTSGETWQSLLIRLKNAHFSSGYTQFRKLRMTVDGVSNMIFHCVRWNSAVSVWESSRSSDSALVIYQIATSSTSAAFRKFQITSGGTSITLLTSETAESSIRLMGLNNNE